MGLWNTVNHWGASNAQDIQQHQAIVVTNRMSILIAGLTFLLFAATTFHFGFIYSAKLALFFTVIFLLPLIINKAGFISAGRVLFSIVVNLASLVLSIIDKFDNLVIEEFQYFEFRIILLGSTLFPFIIFKFEERAYWLTALLINFLCLILYDPLHELFGVGYYQVGFNGPNYYFINYIVLSCFFIVAVSAYFLKWSFEKSDHKNKLLISNLNKSNKKLEEYSYQLLGQQQQLISANEMIRQQRHLLTQENTQLTAELLNKNKQLTETNFELISHNNDLQQFSYTISHNLRGPVASIAGLLNLLNVNELGPSNLPLIHHFKSSVHSLESTIKDLGNIIDIRNKVTRLRQKLTLTEELKHIKSLLKKEIDDYKIEIRADFTQAPQIFSVKLMVHSILYNLISNAIKYRSPEKASTIELTSRQEGEFIRIDVKDNGLGIDLARFKDKVFSLYKRFHVHVEGKGLGLFLVKLQTEALGGRVEVASVPNEGTTFSVFLKIPENVGEQILFQNDVVKIFFDAAFDSLCTVWLKDHTLEQFDQVIGIAVDFLKTYRTPNLISDIRRVAQHNETELMQIRENYRDQLIKIDLVRVAVIINPNDFNAESVSQKKAQLENAYPAKFSFFESFDQAHQWIEHESLTGNAKSKVTDLPFQ